MQIVIDIDDNLYTRLFDNGENYVTDMRRACVAIRKGKPLTKGYWVYGYNFPDSNYCKCSECDKIMKCTYPMNYCPNCGAKMESEGRE